MAIDFSSGYILKNQTLIATYPFTLACWIYPDVVNIEQAPLALIDKDSVNSYFCDLHVYPNGTCGLRAFNGSVYEETTPAGAISASTWTHLCGVYTSATSRSAYKNGGTKTTTTTSVTLGNLDRVLTGAMLFEGQSILQPFDGKAAEVAIWDVALSDAEVAILALGVSPRLVRPASLKFYLPLVRDIVDYRNSTSPTTLNTSVFNHPRVIYSRGGFSPGVPSASGGTSYDLSTALTAGAALSDSAALTLSATVPLQAQGSVVDGQNATVPAASALTAQATLAQAGNLVLALQEALGVVAGAVSVGGPAYTQSLALSLSAALTASRTLTLSPAITLPVSGNLASLAALTRPASIALAGSAVFAPTGALVAPMVASLSAAAALAAQETSTVVVATSLTISAQATLATQAQQLHANLLALGVEAASAAQAAMIYQQAFTLALAAALQTQDVIFEPAVIQALFIAGERLKQSVIGDETLATASITNETLI